jgi:glycosyltransferase involved in cell wall biosynthesis
MDFVDVDSEKWNQYARFAKFPLSWIYRLEGKRLSLYEKRVAEAFDHSVFVTEAEKRIFENRNPQIQNTSVISNGVDLDYFSPAFSGSSITHLRSDDLHSTLNTQHSIIDISDPAFNNQHSAHSSHPSTSNLQPSRPILLFTGAMDYYANVDGVVWFAKEIFPSIQKKIPKVQFFIVGSKPAKEVLSLSDIKGVSVTGYVPDTREYYRQAMVAVVPLRIARGIQNKILEPMAMGIPVVATSEAITGTQATMADGVRIANSAEEFKEELVGLIKDAELRQECSIRARRYVENHHDWQAHCSRLESMISGRLYNT